MWALELNKLSFGFLFCQLAVCPWSNNSVGLTQLPHEENRDTNICVEGQLQGLNKTMQRVKYNCSHLVGTQAALLKSPKIYSCHIIKIQLKANALKLRRSSQVNAHILICKLLDLNLHLKICIS